jgi:hypothetical protein
MIIESERNFLVFDHGVPLTLLLFSQDVKKFETQIFITNRNL